MDSDNKQEKKGREFHAWFFEAGFGVLPIYKLHQYSLMCLFYRPDYQRKWPVANSP
jgi:hypothetical protein